MSRSVIYYRLQFETASPLAVSAGEGELADRDVMVDKMGKPFIPATAIAGVLRAYAHHHLEEGDEKVLFGYIDDSDLQDSRLRFYDACLLNDAVVTTRDMVALDENGVSKNTGKFDMQAVETGCIFVGYAELSDGNGSLKQSFEKLLPGFNSGVIRLGGKTTRGYGEVSLNAKKCSFTLPDDAKRWLEFDLFSEEAWENIGQQVDLTPAAPDGLAPDGLAPDGLAPDGLTLELALQSMGGLSIREYSTNVDEPDFVTLTLHGTKKTPVIPGTAWAGVFRSRFKEFAGEDLTETVFGSAGNGKGQNGHKSAITFSESQITNSESQITNSESQITKGYDLTLTRNALDRFTSGTKDGALFTEKTHYFGKTTLTIHLDGREWSDKVYAALGCCLCDLHNGLLTVGGMGSIGRGVFTVTGVTVNGKDVIGQITGTNIKGFVKVCNGKDGGMKLTEEQVLDQEQVLLDQLKNFGSRYCMAIWTDRADFSPVTRENVGKLLEVRCFDENGEFLARRSLPGQLFSCRETSDAKDFLDENQYIDIDSTKKDPDDPQAVFTTGGGKWHLPAGAEGCNVIRVRKYVTYDEEGQARVTDWRLVKFEKSEGMNDNEQ